MFLDAYLMQSTMGGTQRCISSPVGKMGQMPIWTTYAQIIAPYGGTEWDTVGSFRKYDNHRCHRNYLLKESQIES